MKRFLKNLTGFVIVSLLCFIAIAFMADGSADASYLRFTTPKQNSLIVGSSRAAQGLRPAILNKRLNRSDIYNYAFTINSTPYGVAYYNSIKAKLKKESANGIFIIGVTPWTLATLEKFKLDTLMLRETNTYIDKTSTIDANPNFEYLIESYQSSYINLVTNKYRKGDYQTFFVHDDGWLEVSIVSDMFSKAYRKRNKIKLYKEGLKTYKGISKYRLQYLEKTIQLFKEYGKVFLVRIPIDRDLLEVEDTFSNDFNILMNTISEKNNIGYMDFTSLSRQFNYTDGNHLDINSSKKFSRVLGDSILNLLKEY